MQRTDEVRPRTVIRKASSCALVALALLTLAAPAASALEEAPEALETTAATAPRYAEAGSLRWAFGWTRMLGRILVVGNISEHHKAAYTCKVGPRGRVEHVDGRLGRYNEASNVWWDFHWAPASWKPANTSCWVVR